MRKDFADAFAAEGQAAKERLERLKDQAVDALDLAISEAQEGSTAQKDNLKTYKFTKEQILPLLLCLEDEGERDAALKDVAGKLKLTIKPLRKALMALEESEQEETGQEESTRTEELAPQPGTKRYERAMELLTSSDILEKASEDMQFLEQVGEFTTKRLALICAVSAKSGRPIQPSTHAQSSAGKNALWDMTLSLLPEEMVVRRSGLTAN